MGQNGSKYVQNGPKYYAPAPPPEAPPTCARATPHVNVDSWKNVRHLPPFGVPDWVNKAL